MPTQKPTYEELEQRIIELENSLKRIKNKAKSSSDFSVLKHTEEKLRATTAKLEALIDVSPLAITLLDSEGNVQLWNKAAEQIFGWTSNEVIGHPNPVVPTNKKIEYINWGAQILQGKSLTNQEAIRQKKDGSLINVSVSSAPVYDEAGNVVGRMAIIADITNRKLAEKALHESEERLRTIIENEPECVKIIDKNGKLLEMNSAGLKMLEVDSLTQLQNYSLLDFILPEYQNSFREIHYRVMKGETAKLEFEIKGLKGTYRWLETNAAPLHDENNKVIALIGVTRDITQRKLVEQALKASEERYRTVVSNTPVVTFVLNEKGIFTLSEGKGLTKLGLQPGQVVGMSAFDVYKDFPLIINSIKNALAGKSQREETALFGTVFDVVYTPVINNEGKIIEVIGVASDITERKLAEEKIIESESRYKRITAGLTDYLYTVKIEDGKAVETVHNEACLAVTGYSSADFGADPYLWINMVFPEDREWIAGRFSKILEGNDIPTIEHRIVRKDGKVRWISDTSIPKYNSNGKIISYDGVIKDITERKHIEEELKNALSLTHATLESIHNGILAIDVNGKVIKANTRFAEMWRVPNEVLALNDDKILIDYILEQLYDPESFVTLVKQLYSRPEAESLDLLYFKDGRIFERISKPVYIEKEPKGRVWSFLDITKRMQTEKIVQQQNIDLKELNVSKDRFISILAHDLKSPFNSMLGFLDLLVTNVRNYDIAKIETQINTINKSAQRVYTLLEDILLWAKAQSGKMHFSPQQINFNSICPEVLEPLLLYAENKGIRLNFSKINNVQLYADIEMFKTILRNLVSNSIKFTNTGGQINISASYELNSVKIIVSDNGIGMSDEIVSNLFNISKIYSTEGTAKEKGSGFGLLLCKDFIEKHGGKIWVNSDVGKGTSFFFTLPNDVGK